MFRESIKGRVPAFAELADKFEGRAGTRMQYENVPGYGSISVEETVTRKVEVSGDARDLDEILDDIYGLRNWNRRSRAAVAPVSVPERLGDGRLPAEDSDKGS
jgi:hypothetical protein